MRIHSDFNSGFLLTDKRSVYLLSAFIITPFFCAASEVIDVAKRIVRIVSFCNVYTYGWNKQGAIATLIDVGLTLAFPLKFVVRLFQRECSVWVVINDPEKLEFELMMIENSKKAEQEIFQKLISVPKNNPSTI